MLLTIIGFISEGWEEGGEGMEKGKRGQGSVVARDILKGEEMGGNY